MEEEDGGRKTERWRSGMSDEPYYCKVCKCVHGYNETCPESAKPMPGCGVPIRRTIEMSDCPQKIRNRNMQNETIENPQSASKLENEGSCAPSTGSDSARPNDKGVLRKYFEAKPNKMFSELTTACIRFVRYADKVPCAVCGKQSKKHWTCVMRFKAADINDHPFMLKLKPNYFATGTPVCEDHPMQPDEKEFLRKVRAAQRKL